MTDLKEIYSYVENRNKAESQFLDSILAMYIKNAQWSSFIVRLVVRALGLFIRPKNRKVKYFFGA